MMNLFIITLASIVLILIGVFMYSFCSKMKKWIIIIGIWTMYLCWVLILFAIKNKFPLTYELFNSYLNLLYWLSIILTFYILALEIYIRIQIKKNTKKKKHIKAIK
jgi:hypothetical protein